MKSDRQKTVPQCKGPFRHEDERQSVVRGKEEEVSFPPERVFQGHKASICHIMKIIMYYA